MNEKPKTKWYWRLLRWGLVGLAVVITLAAILITEENWRGKRDLASLVPPVPDDQNFFCAPIVAETLDQIRKDGSDHSGQSNYRLNFNIYRGEMADWITNGGYWQKGRLFDLKEWQGAFRKYCESPEGKTNGFPIAVEPQTPAADILLALAALLKHPKPFTRHLNCAWLEHGIFAFFLNEPVV